MPVVTEEIEKEKVVDDLDSAKLQELKEKLKIKKEQMAPKIIETKKKSLKIGVVGTGQAGSRLAESFYKLGYDAVAFNTAQQDLQFIEIPEENKCLLAYGLGGAAKDLEIGREAAETNRDAINALIQEKLDESQVLMLCVSLGGGSGAGSVDTMIEVMSTSGKPILVMTVIPMSNDDAQTKKNALQTLAKLAKFAQSKVISNLIVVDNAKIETIYSDVSQMEFFNVSNKAIVEPIDAFNTLSSMPSPIKAFDPMEFAKTMTDGGGLTVYGQMLVSDYTDETAIASAIIDNLSGSLLSGGFDLKQSKYVGVIVEANKKVWDKIPAASVNYAVSMVQEVCSAPNGVFRGIYVTDMKEDAVKVYSVFSGLGLPDDRVQQLKKEAQELDNVTKTKDVERNLTLKLDTGVEETVSAADKIKQKIAAKKSAFGGLVNATVQDKRKK